MKLTFILFNLVYTQYGINSKTTLPSAGAVLLAVGYISRERGHTHQLLQIHYAYVVRVLLNNI